MEDFDNPAYIRSKLEYIPLGDIKPKGWLLKQLQTLADGLTGHLEEIWPSVGPDNGWLGGSGDDWERGPYYLDGLLPLAEILNDDNLRKKALKWIDWSLSNRRDDGFFGPTSNLDWWPRMVMLKVLIQYIEVSNDDSALSLIHDFFKFLNSSIEKNPFAMWAYARGYEFFVSLFWLLERLASTNGELPDDKRDEYVLLLDTAKRIVSVSMDWIDVFRDFKYTEKTGNYLDWEYVTELITNAGTDADHPSKIDNRMFTDDEYLKIFNIYHQTHGVNLAMALKYPAYAYQLTGDRKYLEVIEMAYENLMQYHGQANGMFSCDEHLNGREPYQGTELCTVVETMFSLEEIIRVTGDLKWGDVLEEIAFNALPATISMDGCSHQYDQQVNQVICSVAPRAWYNNGNDSNIFGLEPNFGCCTANMHQGWPKLIRSAWMVRHDRESGRDTLVFVVYSPLRAKVRLSMVDVDVQMKTDYPFDGKIDLYFSSDGDGRFDLLFRIPNWVVDYKFHVEDNCSKEIVKEEEIGAVVVKNCSGNGHMSIRFEMIPRFERFVDGVVIGRGPLLFALPVRAKRRELVRRGRFSDWELYPDSEWRYAFKRNAVENSEVLYNGGSKWGFKDSNPHVRLKLNGWIVENWKMENNSVGKIPIEPILRANKEEVYLIPYGCTDLRVAVFPYIG